MIDVSHRSVIQMLQHNQLLKETEGSFEDEVGRP